MATFAKTGYPAAKYAAHRLPPPPSLFNTVLDYHHGPRKLCVDLGTGHGVAAHGLANFFPLVLGIDPSEGMLRQAQSQTASTESGRIEYHQSVAEDMSFIESCTVDLVLAVQAAHWFDPRRIWDELYRIVRPEGTVAFWNWGRYFLIGRPCADRVLRMYSDGPEHLGPYWPRPGHTIWNERMRAVECADLSRWEDIARLEYEPCLESLGAGTGHGVKMFARLKLSELESLLRTWSSVHEWSVAHPSAIPKAEGGNGDIIDALMEEMIHVESDWKEHASREDWREIAVEVETRSILLLARRRG
ncbi:class I SAM-dependent methyltransferase [Aspergillus novofumigatus IBT 16806]|uniref:S-adenosyl-L-methionine-dependent methyltransferase n=1 Tax=Aspergillus novofumigatus (strain IBT 16806) TaxID=1392255 RepID=A0A2I1CJM8_ASPN1|nr:S-adenosyl-L-methionine-dependent methyltransferase [Aspergillus novofumigatus IBT 16806]PKX97832.1 S-adenosyl-L-methionine-dependent methyltransferase [Aspergillus novofumigatus IBT 16806]